ncbi:MAG: hypothetical protein R2851_20655 [Caldilineaceae bacterium]
MIYYPHPAADDGIPTGSSLTGLAIYGGDALPAAYHGSFFWPTSTWAPSRWRRARSTGSA